MSRVPANTSSRSTRVEPLGAGPRFGWLLVAMGSLAMLVVGWLLVPAAEGHGTHTQLGLYPCPWLLTTGHPCPTCGWTTGVTYAAHGNLAGAFRAQPFAVLLALGAAMTVWIGGYVALTGSRVGSMLSGLLRPRILWTLSGLLIAAWVYKLAVTPAS